MNVHRTAVGLVLVAGVVVACVVGGWALTPATPLRAERRAPPVSAVSAVALRAEPVEDAAIPSRPVRGDRVRQALVSDVSARSPVAAFVLTAMDQDGDSDPRLLAALAAVGVRPTWLLGAAASIDPWLAVGVLDLERQVVDRCETCGWDLEGPAADLLAVLDDEQAACVVRGVTARTASPCGPR